MEAWGMTHVGAVREVNQDAFAIHWPTEETLLCLVCDGMGGALAGDVASRLAVAEFSESVGDLMLESGPYDELMRRSAARANRAIYDHAAQRPECHGMGTTLVAALLTGESVWIANVGDSRAYRISEHGITRVTKDHSVVEDLVQRGELTPEQARQHPQKNLITRALGSEPSVECDTYSFPVEPGEYLMLCSDGLTNTMHDQEILYEIIHGGRPEECCRRLTEVALSRGAPDNVTTVLIRL